MPARPIFDDEGVYEHPIGARAQVRRDRWPPAPRCRAMSKNGNRCKRFASRESAEGLCRGHNKNAGDYSNIKLEDIVSAQDLVLSARDLAEKVHHDLRHAAPVAVEVMVAIAQDEDISPAVRIKAASEIIRHSGMSLEKGSDFNVTIAVSNDATRIVQERLDRLAACPPIPAIEGELAS